MSWYHVSSRFHYPKNRWWMRRSCRARLDLHNNRRRKRGEAGDGSFRSSARLERRLGDALHARVSPRTRARRVVSRSRRSPMPSTDVRARNLIITVHSHPAYSLALSVFDLDVHFETEPGYYCCTLHTPPVLSSLLHSSTPLDYRFMTVVGLLVQGSLVYTVH